MIVNQKTLLQRSPIVPMPTQKWRSDSGISYGLTEAGVDIRIAQDVTLHPFRRFVLASSVELFNMPTDLCAFVLGKSTWARKGVNVQSTLIEPGWHGYLTLEIHLQSNRIIRIREGEGIAAVLFARLTEPAQYSGPYQGQPPRPVPAAM